MAERIGMGMWEARDRQVAAELDLGSDTVNNDALSIEVHVNNRAWRSRERRELYRHPQLLREYYWH